ncbi:hypothetical protein OIB37_19690 [Streptomyces sp. NBC_00820]|uniref:hypothetical protein n=1 Tax=Streptomyces sp. NBC_00820 TaxID=2975842 RepID=UPI002ED548A7|nr:hypothetical protein OIB37_19690 [Streptomyces sp. NBC_00820]
MLWLIGGVTGGIAGGVGLARGVTTDQVIARAYGEIWPLLMSDAVVIGAAVAGACVVRAVTAVQMERIATDARADAPEAADTAAEFVG